MTYVVWDESMETGDLLVDSQHQGLVALFNEMVAADQHVERATSVSDVLERLTEYVVVHFAAEEAMMASFGYPPDVAEAHKREHRALTERTRELVLSYRAGEIETVIPLVDFLKAWLSGHIEESDRRLVEHVQGSNG
jgi:hemerythrin-like metal-binding protein